MGELTEVRTHDSKGASDLSYTSQVQHGMMTQGQRVSSPSRAATMRFDRISQILGELAGLKGVAAKYTASTLLRNLSGFSKEDIDTMSDGQKRQLLEQAKATHAALKKLFPESERATELMAKLEDFSQMVEGSFKRSEQAPASPRSAIAPPKVPESISPPVTLRQQAKPPQPDRAEPHPPPYVPPHQASTPVQAAPSLADQSKQKRAGAQGNLKTLQNAISFLEEGKKLRFEEGQFKAVRRGFFPSRAGKSTASSTAAQRLLTDFSAEIADPPRHKSRHAQINHVQACIGDQLIIFAQSAKLTQPSKRSFNNPSFRLHLKRLFASPPDRFDIDSIFRHSISHVLSTIAKVGVYLFQQLYPSFV